MWCKRRWGPYVATVSVLHWRVSGSITMAVTTLQKTGVVVIGVMLILAISTSPAKRASAKTTNLAATEPVTVKVAAPVAEKVAEPAEVKSDIKTSEVKQVEKPVSAAINVEEPVKSQRERPDQGDAAVPAATTTTTNVDGSRPKIDVHVHINVEKQHPSVKMSKADAEKVRAQIMKEISTTSTKVDNVDNAGAAKPAVPVSGTAAKAVPEVESSTKIDTADRADTTNANPKQAQVLAAAVPLPVEKAEVKPAVKQELAPEKQATKGSSLLTLLMLPGLAVVAVFFAAKYRSGGLPEFIEEKLGSSGQSSTSSGLAGSAPNRSMYGSV
eukprot:TRINITY_DN6_c1_g1_i1.p2 TRINITY_DN6_c1_g1~~TRINITY_DN6_c1_g1_i1.p2  ORF type:complete len:327 (+),score=128.30 TRINITY_DN6_c1_g1_i1:40-1020(+)